MAFYNWSKTAASNSNADPTINWAEGQAPSSVNDSARAQMARTAEYRDDLSGSLTTGGTSTAYTLTTNQVFDTLAHMDKQEITFVAHATSGASPTLNVDGLGAKQIRQSTGVNIPTGALVIGNPYTVTYYNTAGEFILHDVLGVVPSGTANAASVAFTASSRLLGRATSGAGNGEEITLSTGLSLSGTTLTAPAVPVPATFKNLVIKVATNTTVTLAADFIAVTDGTNFQTLAFNQTVNLGTTGANALDAGTIAIDTWYHIWAIAKSDGTVAGLASTSSTAPTMPSGYTYKARVGAVLTIHTSAILYGSWQFGRRAQYVVGLAQTSTIRQIQNGNSGSPSVPTWTAFSISNYAPTTAASIKLCLSAISGTVGRVMAAPNNSYGNYASTTNPPPLMTSVGSSSENHSIVADFILESTNVYFAADLSTGTAILSCLGWEDNI